MSRGNPGGADGVGALMTKLQLKVAVITGIGESKAVQITAQSEEGGILQQVILDPITAEKFGMAIAAHARTARTGLHLPAAPVIGQG